MIVIFGLSVMPIVLMGVATAIVAMIIATLNGLDRVPRVLTKVARVRRMGTIATALLLKSTGSGAASLHRRQARGELRFIGVIASEFILRLRDWARTFPTPIPISTIGRCYALMLLLDHRSDRVNLVLHVFDQALGGAARIESHARRTRGRHPDHPDGRAAGVAGVASGRRRDRAPGPVPTLAYLAKFVPTERSPKRVGDASSASTR